MRWVLSITLISALGLGLAACQSASSIGSDAATEPLIDYASQIQPILEANCYECHGPIRKPKGRLRLDTKTRALKGGLSGDPAMIPGNGAASTMVIAITHADPDNWTEMPPDSDPLASAEIDLIKRWIDQGAPWPEESSNESSIAAPAADRKIAGNLAPDRTDELASVAAANRKVSFRRHIYPILKQSCLGCHGPERNEGMLRLDSRSIALEGGRTGPAIVPGNARGSMLLRRVAGLDAKDPMPLKGEKLTAEQMGLIRAWIEQGAHWPRGLDVADAKLKKHWAYEKPVRPNLPQTRSRDWARNSIDRFILARLEAEGLRPSPETDRATLYRRVSLDLIGLPPTPDEIQDFVGDPDEEAYERRVDRLLASPRFGERWARPWLDIARYADTNGYEADKPRDMWPYRDWVIHALNEDMPFDRFTIEQIAGDLLPDATDQQRVATGFHRNTMINEEGGTDPEEFRIAALVDRVNTTGFVWLGTTIACTQCHNHKYDPFTQKEFYQLMAFFNTAKPEQKIEGLTRVQTGPFLKTPSALHADEYERIEAEIRAAQEQYDAVTPELQAAEAKWESDLLDYLDSWTALEPAQLSSAGGTELTAQPDFSILAGGDNPSTDTYVIRARSPLDRITAIRLEALDDERLPKNGPGRADGGNFVLSHLSLTAESDSQSPPKPIELQNATADFSPKDWSVEDAIDADPATGWAVNDQKGHSHEAVFETAGAFDAQKGTWLTLRLDQFGPPRHQLGRFRISVTSRDRPVRAFGHPKDLERIVRIAEDKRGEEQAEKLLDDYKSFAPARASLRAKIADLSARRAEIYGSTIVMGEMAEPRQTHIHVRGNFLNPGQRVYPDVPAVLPPLPEGAPSNRLTLARWLVSRDNPLTARVTVNRLWASFFGAGLVKTDQDFGARGDRPSHPELLDWLAVQFMDDQWSLKSIMRTIVTSATYRQSSAVTPELIETDPANRLLARGPRFRLEAEILRDQALSVAGLLSSKMGGASVFPPQPEGQQNVVYSGSHWPTSQGADRYRRGLYTHWRRTSPYPSFMAFDASSREICVTRRPKTNTPLAALASMNDPCQVEAAQAIARRVMAEAGPGVNDRVDFIFSLCVCRDPDEAEQRRLAGLFEQQWESFRNNADDAERMAAEGCQLPRPEGVDMAQLAAWTVVANMLLNLDETLTKG